MPTGAPRLRTNTGQLNQVGPQLKRLRKEKQLTQDHLCGRIADVTQGMWTPQWRDIVRIERGTRIVSDLEIIALSFALNCEVSLLICPAPGIFESNIIIS
jgi:transcriptional regulator with XRE-family HTH domain